MKAYKTLELKKEIKTLVEKQVITKAQRKTVKLVGDRIIEPDEAQWKSIENKERLRLLYAAYGIMRGKKYSEIENSHPEENHPLKKMEHGINTIVQRFEYEKVDELVA